MTNKVQPRWEVADIFRLHGKDYREKRRLPLLEKRIMYHIESCRTARLGGHLERCTKCGYERPAYNSCRDRHCPKCQVLTKERWLEARKKELLPVNYFHNVFTLPHELNSITLLNKKVVLDAFFKSVSETLKQFGEDKRGRLGGKVGFTLILHTWNQKLLDHFHLHCVIPAGALSKDHQSWIAPKSKKYLFSVRALSEVFRAKFIFLFEDLYNQGKLTFPKDLSYLSNPNLFLSFKENLFKNDWVVYSKAPFGDPERVLEYLGRYTHRVAVSNHRIVNIENSEVTFSYKDREAENQKKELTLSADEFIRRFLLHSLPLGFMRIRHYGFLSSSSKKTALTACREALSVEEPKETVSFSLQDFLKKIGLDLLTCPCCKAGTMKKVSVVKPFLNGGVSSDSS